MRTLLLTLITCVFVLPAYAKYSGGTGEPNDPYRIATAADLIALGEDPNDYDKHFILTADIDLDPNLPGRKVFDKAVIASNWDTPFTGFFDGNSHTISHLTIIGDSSLGLFGRLEYYMAEVRDLGLVDVNITGSGSYVGGLVGSNRGSIGQCYSTGTLGGANCVGGLVGSNWGSTTASHSTCVVSGNQNVGGLVGYNEYGRIATSYSTSAVSGRFSVGGLVGNTWSGGVTQCYSTGTVSGNTYVGGLVGYNEYGRIATSYSTSAVSGTQDVGGLVGGNYGDVTNCYSSGTVSGNSAIGGLVGSGDPATVTHSVWDTLNSGLLGSSGGVGLNTSEMMDPYMLGLNGFASDPNWVLDAGRDYPRLAWEGTVGQSIPAPHIDWLEGQGTSESPYRIETCDQFTMLSKASILCDKHFVLCADINLDPNLPSGKAFAQAIIPVFMGVFDGNEHTISHLTIMGESYLGLFARLESGA